MPDICVVTDVSAIMPPAWRSELPIRFVPLEIAWPDGSTDPGDRPYAEVAARLGASDVPPTTGAPSPGHYQELIGELLETHDGVLVVCPASDLSTTFQSATIGAREVHDERVRVLDSKTAAAGQGLCAAEAARACVAGAPLDEVARRAVTVASRVQIWATLASLDHLRRSGRVPAVAAMGAGALGIHPVVRYAGGSPTPVGIVRSAQRGADRLYGAWLRSAVDGARGVAIAFHTERDADASSVTGRIAAASPTTETHVVEADAALAAHTGAGLLGLAWFWDN